MEAIVTILQDDDDKDIQLTWTRGKRPRDSKQLIQELEALDAMVIPAYGEHDLIVSLGRDTDFEEVLEAIRSSGFETTGAVLSG